MIASTESPAVKKVELINIMLIFEENHAFTMLGLFLPVNIACDYDVAKWRIPEKVVVSKEKQRRNLNFYCKQHLKYGL
jgi:hypothetical protein